MLNKYHIIYSDGTNEKVYKVIAESKQNAYNRFKKLFVKEYKVIDIINYTKVLKQRHKRINSWIIAIAGIFLAIMLIYNVFKTPDPVRYEEYVVKHSDVLWNIASRSDGWNKMDTSDIIEDICKESKCSANIHEGEIIYIPFYNID